VRYKVKAPDLPAYREILEILDGRVPIFVASEKRHLLSTGDLPKDCLEEISARGAEVRPEIQYDLEGKR